MTELAERYLVKVEGFVVRGGRYLMTVRSEQVAHAPGALGPPSGSLEARSGWVPADPTMGRSPVNREEHFARILPNHIIVTRGRNPSTLRGASYWTHVYWPGNSTEIRVEDFEWDITPLRH